MLGMFYDERDSVATRPVSRIGHVVTKGGLLLCFCMSSRLTKIFVYCITKSLSGRDPASPSLKRHGCGSDKITKPAVRQVFVYFVRPEGLEPSTISLRGSYSTN